MAKGSPALLSFNVGELSPLLEARIDIPKYNGGCYKCQNFIPTIQGPARRRSGTCYVAATRKSTVRSWLTPVVIAVEGTNYILEWGDQSLRFFTNRAQVVVNSPAWNEAVNGTTVDGALTWTNLGFPVWPGPNVPVALHVVIIDPFGQLQQCTVAGNTGGSIPMFNERTTPGGIAPMTTDGGVTWTALAIATTRPNLDIQVAVSQWAAVTAFPAHAAVYTAYGIMLVTAGGGGNSGAGGSTSPYQIPTPYAAAGLTDNNGLFALDFVESIDVIYLTHSSKLIPPCDLDYWGGTTWTLNPTQLQGGPFAAINNDLSVAVYADGQTGAITIYASDPIWQPGHVGELFFIQQYNIRQIFQWQPARTVALGDVWRYNGVTYKAIKVNGGTTGNIPPTHLMGAAWDGDNNNGALWEYQDPGYGAAQITSLGAAPSGVTQAITAATAANPVNVTVADATGLANGDVIFIEDVVGMEDLNNQFYVISGLSGNSFNLQTATSVNVNGTAFGTYASGGTVSTNIYTANATVISLTTGGIAQLPLAVTTSDNATSLWAHAAWQNVDGWPSKVKFFRDRLTYGRDGYLWLGVASDYENFNAFNAAGVATADEAISILIPSRDVLQWMLDGDALAVGTAAGEFAAGEINTLQALGSGNIQIKAQTNKRSRNVQPVKIGYEIYFVQLAGRKLYDFTFDLERNQYVTSDVTVLAEHLTNQTLGIIQMAYQQEPDSVIWCVRADGLLLGFTMQREQDVEGWHRHPLGGNGIVESIAVIPTPNGGADELWMIVNRTISGQTVRYVEYLTPAFDATANPLFNAFFVDSGLSFGSPTPVTSVTDPSGHLIGETVDLLLDGADGGSVVVPNSSIITLPRPASVVQMGLNIDAQMVKMRIESGKEDWFGASQGQVKRISKLVVRLFESMGGSYGPYYQQTPQSGVDVPLYPIIYRDTGDPTGEATPLFTGDRVLDYQGDYEVEGRIEISCNRPLPMTIVGLFPELKTYPRVPAGE